MAQAEHSRPVALVTGATGFIGSALTEALLKKGYSVFCLVRSTSNIHALQHMPVRLLFGDLEDPGAIRDACGTIQTVYHVAGAIKAADREGYFRTNRVGTRRLLECLAENNPGLRRFVHVSSLAAAGPSTEGRRLVETDTPNPISWYGESKLQSEQEALKFSKAFRITIVRPSAVYGPRDRETLIIFRMIKRGVLLTPGRFIRRFSLIHADDLAAGIIRAGEQDSPSGEVFFLSRAETYTWDAVGRAIAQALGRHFRKIAFPQHVARAAGFAGDLWSSINGRPSTLNGQKVKELLQPSWLCDSSKARAILGFDPKIDLASGIHSTARWYQDHGWL